MRIAASTPSYSVQCAAAVKHSLGPDSLPFTMATGIFIVEDAVLAISKNPVAFSPGFASISRILMDSDIE